MPSVLRSTRRGNRSELLEDRQVVEDTPVLDDSTIGDSEDVLLTPFDGAALSRDAGRERGARVTTARRDPDGDEIILGDGVIDSRRDIGNGRADGLDQADQSRRPASAMPGTLWSR
jgi:hypothetical protein